MRCQYCGSRGKLVYYDSETKFCRGCGNVAGPYRNNIITRTARLLDFLEE